MNSVDGTEDPDEPDNSSDADENPGSDVDSAPNSSTDSDSEWPSDQDAVFNVNVSLSREIPTVGIVSWSVNRDSLIDASIQFGRNGSVEYTAPVDLEEPNYRTLLLGMKPSTEYVFRIIANDGNEIYTSKDHALTTGAVSNNLPTPTVAGSQNDLADGFIVTRSFSTGWTFILDKDIDYVWWYKPSGREDGVRAKMSFDGKHIINANGNVPGPSAGSMSKVSMDGLKEQMFDVPERHHDAEILPDGTITYFEYETMGVGTCDRVMEMSPEGVVSQIFMVRDYFSHRATNGEWCHSNAINYIPDEDAYTLSILHLDSIIKFRRNGELIWILGGQDTDFPGVSWSAQHQHHWLKDSILIFNNRGEDGGGFETASRAIEYSIDESNLEASLIWNYSSGNLNSMAMGDVKRLPNGNTLVVFSASGTIHEVSPSGEMLREISYGMGSTVGYAEWRQSLYGPPQKYL